VDADEAGWNDGVQLRRPADGSDDGAEGVSLTGGMPDADPVPEAAEGAAADETTGLSALASILGRSALVSSASEISTVVPSRSEVAADAPAVLPGSEPEDEPTALPDPDPAKDRSGSVAEPGAEPGAGSEAEAEAGA